MTDLNALSKELGEISDRLRDIYTELKDITNPESWLIERASVINCRISEIISNDVPFDWDPEIAAFMMVREFEEQMKIFSPYSNPSIDDILVDMRVAINKTLDKYNTDKFKREKVQWTKN